MADMFELPKAEKIQIRKIVNKMIANARSKAKSGNCIMCGKPQAGFCNSHSVPRFVLKNISENGKVLHASVLMGTEVLDIEKGVNNSGTFALICRNCDASFFREYEDEKKLSSSPTDKMFAEIAVKDFLLQISKRYQEVELYHALQSEYGCFEDLGILEEIEQLDIRDYEEELEFHKKIAEKDLADEYRPICCSVLPYKVPIAMQSAIALQDDLVGNRVNDIYDLSASSRMQFMHLGIFPLESRSAILAFYHRRDKAYDRLSEQTRKITLQELLRYLNYLIFAHTENYYISKSIQPEIESNENLKRLAKEKDGHPDMGVLGPGNNFGIGYKPVRMDEIPNFLSREWAL